MKRELKVLLPALVVIAVVVFVMNYEDSQEPETSMPGASTAGSAVDSLVVSSPRQSGEQHPVSESASGRSGGSGSTSSSGSSTSTSTSNDPPEAGVGSARSLVVGSDSTGRQLDSPEQVLSDRVFYVIEEAQQRQQQSQWEESLMELNALYSDFDSMTPFEQATLLNFYTNVLIRLEMWHESISAFSLMLTVENLRPDINARALMALGQLHASVDEVSAATAYYEEWLEFTRDMTGQEAQTAIVEQQLESLRGRP